MSAQQPGALRVHPASAFDSVPRGASREGGERPTGEQLEHPELISGSGSFARIAPSHLRAEMGGAHGDTDSPAGVSPSSPRGFPRPPRGCGRGKKFDRDDVGELLAPVRPAATSAGAGGAAGGPIRPRIVTPDPVPAGDARDNAGERAALLARRTAAEERIAELERELTSEAGDLDLQLPPSPAKHPQQAAPPPAAKAAAAVQPAEKAAPPAAAEVEVKKSGGGCAIM